MSALTRLRYGLLKERYTLFDLCAGNGLVGALAAYLFPRAEVVSLDVRRSERAWERIRRFRYVECDVRELDAEFLRELCPGKAVFVSVHPCTELAEQVIALFNKADFADLLMPCCLGTVDPQVVPPPVASSIGGYMAWVYHLYHRVEAEYKTIYVDEDNLSERNALILASRVGRRGRADFTSRSCGAGLGARDS